MATPPPPLLTTAGATDTTTYNNGGIAPNDILSQQQQQHSYSSSTSTFSSIIIVIIVIASAIIVSASIYLLIRFLSRRSSRSARSVRTFTSADDVVPDRRNESEVNHHHHVIYFDNSSKVDSLPMFMFSSLTGNITGGDCAVCLSKFEAVDQLRLLPLCCHAFHVECIDAWLKSNQTCPLCRSTVNPTEADVMNKILSASDRRGGGDSGGGNRNSSFRIEIGSISRRRTPSDSGRRSYSIGSFEYVLEHGYEIPVESTQRREISECTSVDKDSTTPERPGDNIMAEIAAGGSVSGRLNWLRDYVDRVSVSISSRSQSLRGSGRFFTGSSRPNEAIDDFEATHSRVGEEISELFRWLSGV